MTTRARIARGDDPAAIAEAVALLRAGQLVAFPTETVYGLGADALSAEAVERIYVAKGRPATNPIIVHVEDARAARDLVEGWDARAEQLALRFWPGPLTLVLRRRPMVPAIVAAGGETLAVRAPAHPVARALLHAFEGPLAAPSANRSSAISATRAQDVLDELGEVIPLILDGGPCEVGLESTVLDLSRARPTLLRPGVITPSALEAALGEAIAERSTDEQGPLRSPGLLERHYAPSKPLIIATAAEIERAAPERVAILAWSPLRVAEPTPLRALPADPAAYARALYAALRWADRQAVEAIWVERPPAGEPWRAVHDRLARASVRP
ncbi:MAG: threonylcarbamoyl-AMP synthase [Deltaproteobacteria bacterium]|nr:threonylcarbamoyl-AMP synthase [Deltaproteobacteria bacterium]